MKRIMFTTLNGYCVNRFAASLLMMVLMISLPASAGTYIDNFDDGDFDGWEVMDYKNQGVKWTVENGVLTCRRPSLWCSLLRFGEDEWRNYSAECDAKMVQILNPMHSMGFMLRVPKEIEGESARPYVDFSLWEDNTANISLWTNKVQVVMLKRLSKVFDLQMNRWYHLKAVANEGDFEFYIDGELIASLSDSRAPAGFISLETGGSVVHFDNIIITGDDVPDNTAAVSLSGKLATTWGQVRSQ